MDNMQKDCFDILSLPRNASIEDAKRSYRELVKRWHPDQFGSDPDQQKIAQDRLKEINVAYREAVGILKSSSHGVVTPPQAKTARRPPPDAEVRKGEKLSFFQKMGLFLKKRKQKEPGRKTHFNVQPPRSLKKRTVPSSVRQEMGGGTMDFGTALKSAIRRQPGQGVVGRKIDRCSAGLGNLRYGRGRRSAALFRRNASVRRGPVDRIEKIRPVGRVKKIGE